MTMTIHRFWIVVVASLLFNLAVAVHNLYRSRKVKRIEAHLKSFGQECLLRNVPLNFTPPLLPSDPPSMIEEYHAVAWLAARYQQLLGVTIMRSEYNPARYSYEASRENLVRVFIKNKRMEYLMTNEEWVAWAVERWRDEIELRPLQNVHRPGIDSTWRQVIRKAGGDPDKLLGYDTWKLRDLESKGKL